MAGSENCWGIATNIPDYSSDIYSGKVRDLYQVWLDKYAQPGVTEMLLVTTTGFNSVMFFVQAIEEAGSIEPDDVMAVIEDPDFRFDTYASDNDSNITII